MPFGNLLAPYLDIFRVTAEKVSTKGTITTRGFEINKDRLKNQIVYFTVTAQLVNFALEAIVPIIKRKATQQVEKITTKEAAAAQDPEGEHAFLERVRHEASLGTYDVTGDLREMAVQFGKNSLNMLETSTDERIVLTSDPAQVICLCSPVSGRWLLSRSWSTTGSSSARMQ